jgi:hypothetical protein
MIVNDMLIKIKIVVYIKIVLILQVAWNWLMNGVKRSPNLLNYGLDQQFCGFLLMIQESYRKFCCLRKYWRNRFSTNSFDWKMDWYQRNVITLKKLIIVIEFPTEFPQKFITVNVWKIHRKSLNYSFNLKILQSFVPIFVENSKNMVEKMMEYTTTKEEFNLLDCTTKCALSMICGMYHNF